MDACAMYSASSIGAPIDRRGLDRDEPRACARPRFVRESLAMPWPTRLPAALAFAVLGWAACGRPVAEETAGTGGLAASDACDEKNGPVDPICVTNGATCNMVASDNSPCGPTTNCVTWTCDNGAWAMSSCTPGTCATGGAGPDGG